VINFVAEIVFARPQWIPWAIALVGVLIALSLLSYRSSAMPLGLRGLALAFRACGIGLLVFCWLEPMVSRERPKPQANTVAILVDNSGSMRPLVEKSGAGSDESSAPYAKSERFQSLVSDDAAWILKASQDFRLRKYLFDAGLTPIDTFSEWSGSGASSSLTKALESVRQRFRGQPLAGIVLISDGRSTDPSTVESNEVAVPSDVPIFPVRFAEPRTLQDLRIEEVTVAQSEFETAPVTITASLSHSGFGGSDAVVDLLNASSSVVASQSVRLGSEDQRSSVVFRFRPDTQGVSSYSLIARSKSDTQWTHAQLLANPSHPSRAEITLGNNHRYQVVDRGTGPYRILYLAGRPSWEFKFLRRALDEDAEISLTSLIRIAKKELKFSFRDSKMESTNPLFSGFEDLSEEEKEQYNEPVFARLGVRQAGELQKGFPKDAEELFDYSAVILDDLEHDFLTLDQQQLLRQFVALRGGSLMVLGGQESMRGKGFRNSVLGQLLPVYGDDQPAEWFVPEAGLDPVETIRFDLSREGLLQPFLRLADNPEDERKRLDAMPGFQVWNRTTQIKPGASVLVEGELSDQSRLPILIAQRFGRGRTAAMMLGDYWRWGLQFDGEGPSPLFQSWRQIVRGMIADVPKAIQVRMEVDPENLRSAKVIASVAGPDFQAIDNAAVEVEFRIPDGTTTQSRAQPSLEKVGEYTSSVLMTQPGVYTASVAARGADDSSLGQATTGWVYEPAAAEFAKIGSNDLYLERLARESGGRVLSTSQLEALASLIPSDKVPIREVRIDPFWHSYWILLLAIAFLVSEWLIRRRYGLA
jgi:hypothetical protein